MTVVVPMLMNWRIIKKATDHLAPVRANRPTLSSGGGGQASAGVVAVDSKEGRLLLVFIQLCFNIR